MSDYDAGARYGARRLDGAGFLRWLVGEPFWSAWRWRGWLDSQSVPYPGEPDRRQDTVAWFDRPEGDAPPLAAVVEFMARARGEAVERLAEYTLRVRRELRPHPDDPRVRFGVVGFLVNLTGTTESEKWDMRPTDAGGLGLSSRVGVRNLGAMPARRLLTGVKGGKVARAVLAWVPLLRGADQPRVAREWARLAGEEPDEARRADLGGLARVFAELADRRGVWDPVLEGWSMERSRFLQEIERRGEARGEARGETLGQVRATRAHVLRALERRLGREPPPEVVETVQRQTDLATLERWFDGAMTVGSLDEARALLAQG